MRFIILLDISPLLFECCPYVGNMHPFGLKNAGATYQRAMVALFHDMIHHEIEVYIDDMIARS